MATERLTQRALEQHDKIHPKLQATKERASINSKDDKVGTTPRKRQVSRSESSTSIGLPNGRREISHSSLERQGSKASLAGTRPGAGMSVFRVVAAARAWKKLSQRKPAAPEKPKIQMENTYKLGPNPEEMFQPSKVKPMIEDILTKFLRNFKYTPEGSKQMCLAISSEVKSRVKRMNFPRYKIVCNVIIMQNKSQGSEICSRCIWNPTTDSFASYTFKTAQIVCVANVHAVYFE